MSHEFRAAALSLLIPCDVRREQTLLDWLAEQLRVMGVEESDQPSWFGQNFHNGTAYAAQAKSL